MPANTLKHFYVSFHVPCYVVMCFRLHLGVRKKKITVTMELEGKERGREEERERGKEGWKEGGRK